MPRIDYRGGCKVAWETYDNEAEAIDASKRAEKERDRKAKLGYDFGYQWPGAIKHLAEHPDYDGKDVWVVVVP